MGSAVVRELVGAELAGAEPAGEMMPTKMDKTEMPAFIEHVELLRDRVPSFDRYPFSIPGIRNLTQLKLHPKATFLIGENGTGKSTLLEAIAVADGFNPEGGSRNFNFSTRDSHSELFDCIRLSRGPRRLKNSDGFFLRAESFFNVATELDTHLVPYLDAYGGASLHEQSHGESFLSLVLHRFRGNGLYLLDEPESALSPSRQLSLLRAIDDLVQADSQFIIATHSPIIMAYPNARIYQLTPAGIDRIEFRDTEHYKVTKAFLDRTDTMLRELLAD